MLNSIDLNIFLNLFLELFHGRNVICRFKSRDDKIDR